MHVFFSPVKFWWQYFVGFCTLLCLAWYLYCTLTFKCVKSVFVKVQQLITQLLIYLLVDFLDNQETFYAIFLLVKRHSFSCILLYNTQRPINFLRQFLIKFSFWNLLDNLYKLSVHSFYCLRYSIHLAAFCYVVHTSTPIISFKKNVSASTFPDCFSLAPKVLKEYWREFTVAWKIHFFIFLAMHC